MTARRFVILISIHLIWTVSGAAMAQDAEPMAEADSGLAMPMDAGADVTETVDGGPDMGQVSDLSVPPNNAPANWSCDPQWYEDGICDCGCTVRDVDCPRGFFDICQRHGCPEGQVPWEHRPDSCMRSACGDGWVDDNLGEVCDDREALDSGGCSADCRTVNPGWTCGERAEGCESDGVEPDDMALASGDAMVVDAWMAAPSPVDGEVAAADSGPQQTSTVDGGADSHSPPASDDTNTEFTASTSSSSRSGGCSVGSTMNERSGPTLFVFFGLMVLGVCTRRREAPVAASTTQ